MVGQEGNKGQNESKLNLNYEASSDDEEMPFISKFDNCKVWWLILTKLWFDQ